MARSSATGWAVSSSEGGERLLALRSGVCCVVLRSPSAGEGGEQLRLRCRLRRLRRGLATNVTLRIYDSEGDRPIADLIRGGGNRTWARAVMSASQAAER